jgi:hypothetical protein
MSLEIGSACCERAQTQSQGFLNFDTDLAPYVAKEREWQRSNMKNGSEEDVEEATEKAVYQAMEAFVYNMNTMRSRSGEMCAA